MTKYFRRKFRIFTFLLPLVLVLALSCDQDSIFANISLEQEPKDPRIAGTPTNIIEYGGAVYAASSGSKTLHRYQGGAWTTSGLSGSIRGLASDGTRLYALIGDAATSLIVNDGGAWRSIGSGPASDYSLQNIYGANGHLFAGGRNGNNEWAVFHTNGSADLAKVSDLPSKWLGGVAYDTATTSYFIATAGGGIYKYDSALAQTDNSADLATSGADVRGIMNVNGSITAVTWDGRILLYDGSTFTAIATNSLNYTGGMSKWNDGSGSNDKLLLLAVQGSGSYNKGYREIELNAAGQPVAGTVNFPGTISPSSVKTGDRKKYDASLARYSVNFIHQVSGESVIFAATAKNGLHSLRDGLWNAEE